MSGIDNRLCGGHGCELRELTIEFCTKPECHLQAAIERTQAKEARDGRETGLRHA